MSFCLFICLGFFVPLDNFSLIWRRHHYRWRVANFGLRWALMAIEQWGFFSVPHLLWHGASVYKCHLRGRVTLTPIAVQLSLPVFTTWVCRGWDSNSKPSACGAKLNPALTAPSPQLLILWRPFIKYMLIRTYTSFCIVCYLIWRTVPFSSHYDMQRCDSYPATPWI